MEPSSGNEHVLFHRSQSDPRGDSRQTNIITESPVPLAASLMHGNLHLHDNIQNVIREIQPFMETARTISIANLINRPSQQANTSAATEAPFVVTIENNGETTETQAENANSENGHEELPNDNREVLENLNLLALYTPFLLILLLKAMYDHQDGILHAIVLFVIFAHTNSVVKKEATQRGPRNYPRLLLALLYIASAVVIIFYMNREIIYNIVWMVEFTLPLTIWDVLWYVGLTDLIFKLWTVMLKIFITILPDFIIAFQSRGKIYLFVEAVSQFSRSILPYRMWYYYYLFSYQGAEQVVGILLFAAHVVAKGFCDNSKIVLLRNSFFKLFQTTTIGTSPSKEQIQSAGENCPICHDEYKVPIMLECGHIFCETCVTIWFDREQTCPLCRAKIVDDPSWRDGSTSFFVQIF